VAIPSGKHSCRDSLLYRQMLVPMLNQRFSFALLAREKLVEAVVKLLNESRLQPKVATYARLGHQNDPDMLGG
jgi:hypothetical protein